MTSAIAEYRCCVVVPHFNHAAQFERFLPQLLPAGLPIVVVDDGSEPAQRMQLQDLLAQHDAIELVLLANNSGKGAAVLAGAQRAQLLGYSHMLQIDADGQHAVEGLGRMLAVSREYPAALISGAPVFSVDIPPARLYGRKFSLWWVRLETLCSEIEDVMCGCRIYPLRAMLDICNKTQLGQGMQFDIEVLVRMYWSGAAIKFVPVAVTYPESGSSHFHMLRDNVRISLMHARLVCGMLLRIPALLRRRKSATSRRGDTT